MNEDLVHLVNKLQDALAAANVNIIDLPQIVVVGSQSSGKSSVLENIVGKDFLPRGNGIVTRRPLVLQLIHRPQSDMNTVSDDKAPKMTLRGRIQEHRPSNVDDNTAFTAGTINEWGEFLHKPGQKFFDFNTIREEIQQETDRTCDKFGISCEPITLRVYSPNVLTLTLVDLPGLIKVQISGQPNDIEKRIRELVLSYIKRPNTIILAVTAANNDMANSDALQIAREVDPEGNRTIGVLTKADIMDAGTDILPVLDGKVIPLRLGYVAVVNRSQKDINEGKPITHALEAERRFFEGQKSPYKGRHDCGTYVLARKLHLILKHHLCQTLPHVKAEINRRLEQEQQKLVSLGDPITSTKDASKIIRSIITEFAADFRAVVEGKSDNPSIKKELFGGAKIAFEFNDRFARVRVRI